MEQPQTLRDVGRRLAERTRAFASGKDLDEFVQVLERYERGEIGPDDFKRFRLARGIYGQRQDGVQMVRVKIPQGVLTAAQIEALADVAERWSRGFGHVTTRQNVQLHFVKMADVPACMQRLADAGLTTREACGNTVRNVTACEMAGVCPTEPFDVTPYGEQITRRFLRREPFYDLPRKFKIALSGCPHDCAQGAIHDVGLTAKVQDGVRGFRVVAGGGLSTRPEAARLLHDFLPMDQVLIAIEAILTVFHAHGNRKNKAKARLKFVIVTRGWEFFESEYRREFDVIAAREGGRVPMTDAAPEAAPPPVVAPGNGAGAPAEWIRTNVRRQKQPGHVAVTIRLKRGDFNAAQMRGLARVCRDYGDGTARTSADDQNLVLRWIPEGKLGSLHAALAALDLAAADARTIVDVTSCPGAESCQLAYTSSRELASDISAALEAAPAAAAAADASIKISGCPNSCGRHHIATLGFHGGVKRVTTSAAGGGVDGIVPVYQLHLGGRVDGDGAAFGRQVLKVPARKVSQAVLKLLDLFAAKREGGESAAAFFARVSDDDVRAAVGDLARIDSTTVTPADFVDLGQAEELKVEMGPGECAT